MTVSYEVTCSIIPTALQPLRMAAHEELIARKNVVVDQQIRFYEENTSLLILERQSDTTKASIVEDDQYSTEELIQFHCHMLSSLLQKVVSQRRRTGAGQPHGTFQSEDTSHLKTRLQDEQYSSMVVDEITEVVEVDDGYDNQESSNSSGSSGDDDDTRVRLPESVKMQLQLFITRIAAMYHSNNPFHNFQHASHVTFSTYQLLRSVAAQDLAEPPVECPKINPWSKQFTTTKECFDGLASDALAQFAIVFSALIHDCDHRGVPNATLVKEGTVEARKYKNKSVAEQNSVDIAWSLLEDECFHDLRNCIFPSRRDYKRFRKIVVNVVMATDIADTNLRKFGEQKWERAFSNPPSCFMEARNRKATMALDLIIMLSDISHTMQPFDVYCKWNERLYREMYAAYHDGRSVMDPSESWYEGEFFFFDKHIIPLAMRIQETGVFGPVADTLLENAISNREQWESVGHDIFLKMQQRMHEEVVLGTAEVNDVVTYTTQSTSIFSKLSFLCCRGSRPMYQRTQTEDDDAATQASEDNNTSNTSSCWRSRAKLS